MGKDFILFIDDFSPNKVPPSNGKRYYMFGTAPAAKSGHYFFMYLYVCAHNLCTFLLIYLFM